MLSWVLKETGERPLGRTMFCLIRITVGLWIAWDLEAFAFATYPQGSGHGVMISLVMISLFFSSFFFRFACFFMYKGDWGKIQMRPRSPLQIPGFLCSHRALLRMDRLGVWEWRDRIGDDHFWGKSSGFFPSR